MEYISLGSTGLLVSRTGISGKSFDELGPELVDRLAKAAFEGGINYFATSHLKPESEKLLGKAVKDFKSEIVISTTTAKTSIQELRLEVDESIENLGVEKIDLLLLDNPKFVPESGEPDGIYQALETIKESGKVSHIGIATEDFDLAKKIVSDKIACMDENYLFEVIAHPFNMLCTNDVEELTEACGRAGIGFIAQKPLCGGILTNIPLALGYFTRFEDVVPVWSVKVDDELQQILYFSENPPVIDDQFNKEAGEFREFFN